jgi:hypothetical protein
MPTITPENNDEVRLDLVIRKHSNLGTVIVPISGRICETDASREAVSVTIEVKPYKLVALIAIADLEWNSVESVWKVKTPVLDKPPGSDEITPYRVVS